MKRRIALAATATAALLALSACDPAFPQGPAGTVSGKSSEYHSSTKTRWYFLTTTSRFRVDFGVYNACAPGEAYPTCAGAS